MDPLITLAQAIGQLSLPTGFASGSPLTDSEQLLILKMEHATAIVVDYLKMPDDHGWTIDTVPPVIRAAILETLGDLWRFRGDDVEAVQRPDNGRPPIRVAWMLERWRDLTMA